MTDTELMVVATFLNRIEAELARGALEAAQIESMVSADDAGGMRPGMWLGREVRLMVRAEDAARARNILVSHKSR